MLYGEKNREPLWRCREGIPRINCGYKLGRSVNPRGSFSSLKDLSYVCFWIIVYIHNQILYISFVCSTCMLLDILLDIMEELSVTISHGIKLLHLLDILTI